MKTNRQLLNAARYAVHDCVTDTEITCERLGTLAAWNGNAALRLAILSLAVLVTSCGKNEEVATAATPAAPVAAVAPAPAINVESEIANALSGQAPAPLRASAADLQREAEAILDKYPATNAADLLNVPEVKPKLRTLLAKLAQDKALQARINLSVDLAAQIKGLEGSSKLDLDMKGYDRARASRMLQASLSEDPQQLVAFLISEIGEATPDLSYGGLERAPNGVAIVPNPDAQPAPTVPGTPAANGQD